MIVLSYSFDEFDISLEIKFWIIISINFFFTTTTLKSFYWFETSSKKHLLTLANRFFFSVSMITSIFESKNQSTFRQNFQYWQFHISIWIIVDFWKTSKIISVNLANWFEFSSFVIKLITFRIQISNQFFKFLIFSFNISTRTQYWNHSSFLKTLSDHICFNNEKISFFSSQNWTQ